MILLELTLGFGIGLSLGLLGSGGSILTVPALVYLVGQTPHAAVTMSLAIVGANSMIGAMFHRAQGTLDWNVALTFGSARMLVSYLSANISKHFSAELLLIAMNSLAGFIGYVGRGSFDLFITLIFVSAGLVGTFSGSKLSSRLSSSKLQKAFAIFVIALGFFLLIDNFSKLF